MSELESIESFVLTNNDWNDILRLFVTAYCPFEPLGLGLHITNEDLLPFIEDAMTICIGSNASFGMRDKSTGKAVGFILNMIIDSPDTELFSNTSYSTEESNLYAKVMYDFCSEVNVWAEDGVTKQIEMFMLAVEPEYRCQGLAKEFFRLSEEKGKEMGCNILSIQATNFITDIIATKRGYKRLQKLDISTLKKEDGQQLLDLSAMNGNTHFTYLCKRL